MSTVRADQILNVLVDWWKADAANRRENVRFASDTQADKLVKENLFAFLLAASLDRAGKAFALWNIPHQLAEEWGHLDPERIQTMASEDLARSPAIARAPSQASRHQLAKTVISLATVVRNEYGGKPERMLQGSISEIMESLQRVYGVGPNIARMIIIQRMLYFGLRPEKRGHLLPKLDVHVKRVLECCGVVSSATEESVGRLLMDRPMEAIAIIDQACWDLGRNYCRPSDPRCDECPLTRCCHRVGVSRSSGDTGEAS